MMRLWIYGAVAVGAIAAVVGLYTYGYSSGKAQGRLDQMKATLEAIEDRKEIDNEVGTFDDVRVCIELGGMPDQCNELRGVVSAPEG